MHAYNSESHPSFGTILARLCTLNRYRYQCRLIVLDAPPKIELHIYPGFRQYVEYLMATANWFCIGFIYAGAPDCLGPQGEHYLLT